MAVTTSGTKPPSKTFIGFAVTKVHLKGSLKMAGTKNGGRTVCSKRRFFASSPWTSFQSTCADSVACRSNRRSSKQSDC